MKLTEEEKEEAAIFISQAHSQSHAAFIQTLISVFSCIYFPWQYFFPHLFFGSSHMKFKSGFNLAEASFGFFFLHPLSISSSSSLCSVSYGTHQMSCMLLYVLLVLQQLYQLQLYTISSLDRNNYVALLIKFP